MQKKSCQLSRYLRNYFSVNEFRQTFDDWVRALSPIRQTVRDSERSNQDLDSRNMMSANSDAIFVGWQETSTNEFFALYNVIAKQHPLYRSTVSEITLRQRHLNVPATPLPPGKIMRLKYDI
jgi:hypothetical protein